MVEGDTPRPTSRGQDRDTEAPESACIGRGNLSVPPLFTLETTSIPRHELPQGQLSPDVAYQIIHDELMLDGNARLNLATFVTTWMEPQAERLMAECSTRT